MNSLIIPAAGKSSRYPGMKPKWLLTHPDGSLMIEKVLNALELSSYDKVIVTILQEHCDKHEADLILRQALGDNIEICILPHPTPNPVATVLETINQKKLKGFVTVKDSDCIVQGSFPLNKQFIAGLTIKPSSEVNSIQSKSFIKKNEDGLVIDITEKDITSNVICLGVYGLNVDKLISNYKNIINNPTYQLNNEIYISHVISLALLNLETFEYIESSKFIDWGTLDDWRKEQKKHSTYILDIDGVLLKNTGKYGSKNWSNSINPLFDNLEAVKKLQTQGAEIILMTARPNEHLDEFKKILTENGIFPKNIITNCNHAKRVIVNDFAPTNPYPSCSAVSIPRNSPIEDYLIT